MKSKLMIAAVLLIASTVGACSEEDTTYEEIQTDMKFEIESDTKAVESKEIEMDGPSLPV